MGNSTIRIRNDWDRQIVESVLVFDEYRLRELHASGFNVRWALDVGSHIGSFAMLVKQIWPDAQILCIEPDPTAPPYWNHNTQEWTGLFFYPVAIGPANGPETVRLFHSLDRNAAANFTAEIVQDFAPLPDNRSFDEVASTSILNILARHGHPELDLVKLDCEGAEAMILEELQQAGYLSRIHNICGEWHYFESIPRLQAALAATHELDLYRHEYPWGSFQARRRRE